MPSPNDDSNLNLVSVIIRYYRRSDYIAEAIHSVLGQTYPYIEILVIDDGSIPPFSLPDSIPATPRTIKVIHTSHEGRAAALNTGLKNALGNFIIFLDDDDQLDSAMFAESVAAIRQTQSDVVAVGYKYFHKTSDVKTSSIKFPPTQINLNRLLNGNPFPLNTLLLRKDVFENDLCFDTSFEFCEEWDLWIRLVARGAKIISLRKCLAHVRIHSQNASRNELLMHHARLQVIQKANGYLSPPIQKKLGLNKRIALRLLICGWYTITLGSRKEGRTHLLSAAGYSRLTMPIVMFIYLLSFSPRSFLKSLTFLIEVLTKKVNIYR